MLDTNQFRSFSAEATKLANVESWAHQAGRAYGTHVAPHVQDFKKHINPKKAALLVGGGGALLAAHQIHKRRHPKHQFSDRPVQGY